MLRLLTSMSGVCGVVGTCCVAASTVRVVVWVYWCFSLAVVIVYDVLARHVMCAFFVVCASSVIVVGVGFLNCIVACTRFVVGVCVSVSSDLVVYSVFVCICGVVRMLVSVLACIFVTVGVGCVCCCLSSMRGMCCVVNWCRVVASAGGIFAASCV